MHPDAIDRADTLIDDARHRLAAGELDAAQKGLRDAVLLLRQLGSAGDVPAAWRRVMGRARLGYYELARARGDLVAAEQALRDGLAVCTEDDAPREVAALERNLAALLCKRGDPDAAMGCLGRAQALCRHLGDRPAEAAVLIQLARTLRRAGDAAAAVSAARSALAICARAGASGSEIPALIDDEISAELAGRALLELGAAERERGHDAEALEALRAALEIAIDSNSDYRPDALAQLAEAALQRGEHPEAAALARRALALDGCPPITRGQLLGILGASLAADGDFEAGLALLERSVLELSATHCVFELARALFRQAHALAGREHPLASRKARRAAELFEALGNQRLYKRAASLGTGSRDHQQWPRSGLAAQTQALAGGSG